LFQIKQETDVETNNQWINIPNPKPDRLPDSRSKLFPPLEDPPLPVPVPVPAQVPVPVPVRVPDTGLIRCPEVSVKKTEIPRPKVVETARGKSALCNQ